MIYIVLVAVFVSGAASIRMRTPGERQMARLACAGFLLLAFINWGAW